MDYRQIYFPFSRVLLLIILLLGSQLLTQAQETKVVTIINADKSTFDRAENPDVRKFIGDVIFEIDSTYLYCDTALLNQETKDIEAFGNIHIKVSDTMNLYGDILHYTGENRIANIYGDVVLIDNTTTLTTDHLVYDRNHAIAKYTTGGQIVDSVNRLTSIKGYYETANKKFTFHDSVRVHNPDYTMKSDTLMYNTISKTSYFYGPSWIESEENTLYAEHGWYNTLEDVTRLQKNAFLNNGKQTLRGDSLFFNRNTGYGNAHRNIWLRDTEQDILITGHRSEYFEEQFYAYVTDSARAVLIDETDSLFVSGDTLYATFDSTQQLENVYSFFETRFFHRDLQGACDSLQYSAVDSVITMFADPVIWAQESQITADTIGISLNGNEIEYMELFSNSLISSFDTLDWYNQIKGKYMKAFFRNNNLDMIKTNGNAESIYYVKDDDGSLIGVNKSVSSSMTIYFEDNKFSWITFIEKPDVVMKPLKDTTGEDRFFPDFEWLEEHRPKNKMDVY